MKLYTASHSDIAAWLENNCPLQYLFKRKGVRKAQPTIFEVVGDGTHEAATEVTTEAREAIVRKHVARLPEEQREEAQTMIEQQLEAADEHEKEAPVEEQEREKLERWRVPGTNWELVIKSDRIGWLDVREERVLQISDLKSGLNPQFLIYHLEFDIQEARRELAKKSANLRSIEEQILKAKLEVKEGDPKSKSQLRRVEYLEGVKAKVEAQVTELDQNVRYIARKLSRLNKKLERIKSQLFFFAMVAAKTREYDKPIRLQAEFLGTVEDGEFPARRGGNRPAPDAKKLVFWYQPDVGQKALSYYTSLLVDQIEVAHEEKNFPSNPGYHCRGCDFRDSCPAFKAWDEKRLVQINGGKPDSGETRTRA